LPAYPNPADAHSETRPPVAQKFHDFADTGTSESNSKKRRWPKEQPMQRTTAVPVVLMLLALSACAYPQYVNDEYRYIPLTNFSHDNRSFRIFDKPSAGRLIITPSLSTAVSNAVIRNATFGEYDNATGQQTLEKAVEAYFNSLGRKCTLTGSSLIYDPQWEFTYECEVRYTATP
jgi:hypothetical protein